MDGHNVKKYSAFCFILIAVFYIIQVSVLGYTVYFLEENGFKAYEVGMLLTAFGIMAAVLQPILGTIDDRSERIDFKTILTWTGLADIVLFICLYFFDKNKIAIGILFGLVYVFNNSMSPFVNTSCFYYKDKGIDVDFGMARGFGSFSFAVVSYILGNFARIFGSKVVSINGAVSAILFFIVIIIFPRIKDNNKTIQNKTDAKANTGIIHPIRFITKYPSFFLMVVATIFAMCFQNADCGYLIQMIENLGGNSYNLGIAISIAAIVEIPTMFLITKVMKKIKVKKLIVIACAFYILRAFIYCVPSMTTIYVAQILQMFTFAIITPATVYLSDEMMRAEDKNKGQTLIGMAVTMGLILGSFVGGELISAGGVTLLQRGCIVIAILSFIFAMLGNYCKTRY